VVPGVVVAARRGECAVVTTTSSSDGEDRCEGGHGQGWPRPIVSR
jgi:hypothetical protein